MDDDTRVPRFQLDDAIRQRDKYQQKYLEAQAKLDRHTARESVRDALTGLGPDADVDNLRAVLEGRNLRAESDKGLIDFDPGDGKILTVTPAEAVEMMKGLPEKFGNLFSKPRPKEPTKAELFAARVKDMPMDKYMRERERPGFLDGETE
jgi:hypothetical protein